MKRPAFQFYPGDWHNDAALRMCSLAARGLWMDMLCVMHAAEPYGHLVAGGEPIDAEELARIVGDSKQVVTKLLSELAKRKVYSVTEDGIIYSRRMVRDEKERESWRARQSRHRDVTRDVTQESPNDVTSVSRRSSSSSSSSSSTPTPPTPSADAEHSGANGHDLLGIEGLNRTKPKRRPAKFVLTEGWYPSESTIEWLNGFLAEHGLSEDWGQRQHNLFIGKAKANAWTYANWDQAYRNFMTENGPGGRYWSGK